MNSRARQNALHNYVFFPLSSLYNLATTWAAGSLAMRMKVESAKRSRVHLYFLFLTFFPNVFKDFA